MTLRDRYSITNRLTVLVVAVGIGCAALALAAGQLWQRHAGSSADTLRQQLAQARRELQQAQPADREAVAAHWRARGLQISRLPAMAPMPVPGQAPPGADGRGPPPPAFNPAMPQPPGPERTASGPPADRPMPPMPGMGRAAELQALWPIANELWTVELADAADVAWRAWLPTLGALVLLVAGSMLASTVAVRWITRPITRLAHDLYEQRQHLRPIAPGGRVSVELQEIITAYNSLVQALQSAEDTRRHMLAGLSHDLRTPLARLRLRTEIELGEAVSDKMVADFDALGRIIDQFIIYTQSETALVWDEPEALDDLVTLTVDRYDAAQVSVSRMDLGAAQLQLPALPIDRALSNLIDNALAYGLAPVEVEVEVRQDECAIWVYDHGRGVPAGMLPAALQPFVRLRSDVGSAGHCGLGLAIVAQVARQFEGRVAHQPWDGRRSGLGLVLPTPDRERRQLTAAA